MIQRYAVDRLLKIKICFGDRPTKSPFEEMYNCSDVDPILTKLKAENKKLRGALEKIIIGSIEEFSVRIAEQALKEG